MALRLLKLCALTSLLLVQATATEEPTKINRRLLGLHSTKAVQSGCYDMFSGKYYGEPSKLNCPEGGGMRRCENGRWWVDFGTCTDKDISIYRVADSKPIWVNDANEVPKPDTGAKCIDLDTRVTYPVNTVAYCKSGGQKVCGADGKWQVRSGTCSDNDLSIVRSDNGNPTWHVGDSGSPKADSWGSAGSLGMAHAQAAKPAGLAQAWPRGYGSGRGW